MKERQVEWCGVEKGQRKFMKSYLNMEKTKTNGCKEKYPKYQHLQGAGRIFDTSERRERMNIAKTTTGASNGPVHLERWEYGNPEEVAARRQAQSCHGCRYEETVRLASQHTKYCGKGRKHGKHCALYQPEGV
jgi:hypothetical protein